MKQLTGIVFPFNWMILMADVGPRWAQVLILILLPLNLVMKLFREPLIPLTVDLNLNMGMIVENGGIVAQLGMAL